VPLTRWWRPVLVAAFVAYLGALALILLGPSPRPGTETVALAYRVLMRFGVPPDLATTDRVEVLMNVVLLAPLPAIGGLIWASLSWRDWTAYAFVLSMAAETWQGVAFATRSASYSDVVANTTGAFMGALVATGLRATFSASKAGRPPDGEPPHAA
jgi:hypothetical protein